MSARAEWHSRALQLITTGSSDSEVAEVLGVSKAAVTKMRQRSQKDPEKLSRAVADRLPSPEVVLTEGQNEELAEIVMQVERGRAEFLRSAFRLLKREVDSTSPRDLSDAEKFRLRIALEGIKVSRAPEGFAGVKLPVSAEVEDQLEFEIVSESAREAASE